MSKKEREGMTIVQEWRAKSWGAGRCPMTSPLPERESDIQAAIRDYLRWMGWLVWKNHQTLGSYRGLADLTAVKAGRVVFIEVKTAAGRLSEDQKQFRDDLLRAGGTYVLARSVEDVERSLKLMEVV